MMTINVVMMKKIICAYCGGEFGSWADIDCHRRHRSSIGTPCADPMNSKSMSLTQRGGMYTGNLRLHDTLGVCSLVLVIQLPEPAEVGVRFCKLGKRRHRSAKLDTEDSDTADSDMPTSSRPTLH